MSFTIFNTQFPYFNNDATSGVTLKSIDSTSIDFVLKRLRAGSGVTLTETDHYVSIAATGSGGTVTSIASAGGTQSLVASGSAPVPTIKGLNAGSNITLTPNGSTGLTIASTGGGTTVLSAGGPGSSLVFAAGPPTAQIKTLQSSNSTINVADAGTSIDLTVLGNPGGVTSYADISSVGMSLIWRAGGGATTTPATGNLQLKTLVAGTGIAITQDGAFSNVTISNSSMGTTDVQGFPGNNAVPTVFNNGGNPVYILAISGDAYSSSVSSIGGGVNAYAVNGNSQVQLDCTVSSVTGGTYNMVYTNSSRSGAGLSNFSQIKSINVNSTSLAATLSITDDGNGHLTFNLV